MAFQKKTKQDEQYLVFLFIESREVRANALFHLPDQSGGDS